MYVFTNLNKRQSEDISLSKVNTYFNV